jgi:hypothetical protein
MHYPRSSVIFVGRLSSHLGPPANSDHILSLSRKPPTCLRPEAMQKEVVDGMSYILTKRCLFDFKIHDLVTQTPLCISTLHIPRVNRDNVIVFQYSICQ